MRAREDAVYEENDGYLPEKILTHESVAYWDLLSDQLR